MSQFQALVLAIGGFQGLLLFILLVTDKRVNYASKILGFQCLLLAITFVLPIVVADVDNPFVTLLGWLIFLPASYGALTYLYCRCAMMGSALRWQDSVHLLPLLLCYALNYDLLFSAERALSFVTATKLPGVKYLLTNIIFYGQSLLYALLLIYRLYRFQTQANQRLSTFNPDIFKWLWCIAAFMVSTWLLKVIYHVANVPQSINLLADLLLVLMVYIIAILQWRNPRIFHIQKLQETLAQPLEKAEEKSNDGVLDEEIRSSILQLVQQRVSEQQLYRDPELTLTSLAEQVGIGTHQLSETLNLAGGKNFNRFINEFRVAEVCQQLEQQDQRKVIDLAMEAGFSSKSSFNAIFKKLTGQTPSEYRRQLAS